MILKKRRVWLIKLLWGWQVQYKDCEKLKWRCNGSKRKARMQSLSRLIALSQGIFLLYASSKGCYCFSMCLEMTSCSKRVWKAKNGCKRKRVTSTCVPKMSESTGLLVKLERIDMIGVDNFFCVLPPYLIDRCRQQFENIHYLGFMLEKV